MSELIGGKLTAKEAFTIPNIMGYFRIALIPVYAWIYLNAATDREYYLAAALVGISGITDMLDGLVARKLHQITELGKFIDPLADKLTQGALVLCLASRYRILWAILLLFVVKEGFMGIMGLILLRKGRKLDGAMWFGKVCTAVLYLVMFLLLLFPRIPTVVSGLLITVCGILMAFSLVMYIPVFYRMWKEAKQ